MRKSKQIILAIILTAALIGVSWYAGRGRVKTPVATVLVTRHAIQAGTRLSAEDISTITIAKDLMIDAYLTDPLQAEGFWTSIDLSSGELLNRTRLTAEPAGLTYPDVAPGRRLMTIELAASDANGFWLTSGSLVDLFLIPKNNEIQGGISVLEKIRIVALLDGEAGTPALATQDRVRNPASPLLCLDLSPEQAELIAGCTGIYDLKLAAICQSGRPVTSTP